MGHRKRKAPTPALDRREASWGGMLELACCVACGELCWFSEGRRICVDCDPVAEPARREGPPRVGQRDGVRRVKLTDYDGDDEGDWDD